MPKQAAPENDIRTFFSGKKAKKEKQNQIGFDEMEQLIDASWKERLQDELEKPYFNNLKQFLVAQDKKKAIIYPPTDQLFSAFNHCTFDKIKVVIIGQDPYHGPNQAHGLCFSVQRGIRPPPSLMNIFKEASSDVGTKKPSHGCLTSWSDQGVLLLNTVLTVQKATANSHRNQGWETFTDAIIRKVSCETQHVVFLLWGAPAQKKAMMIDTEKHLVLKSSHPSPLGATKTDSPFIGSKCFSKTNEYLKQHGKDEINWQI